MSRGHSNCLLCAIPALLFAGQFTISLPKLKRNHSGGPEYPKRRKLLQPISLIIAFVNLLASIYCSYHLLLNQNPKYNIIIILDSWLFSSAYMILFWFEYINWDNLMLVWKGLFAILQTGQNHMTYHKLLPDEEVHFIHVWCLLYIYPYFILVVMIFPITFALDSEDIDVVFIVVKIFSEISNVLIAVVILQGTICLWTYSIIMRQCLCEIKSLLTLSLVIRRHSSSTNTENVVMIVSDNKFANEKFNLSERLKKLSRVYQAVFVNFQFNNYLYRHIFTIHWVLVIIVITNNLYYAVLTVIYAESYTAVFVMFEAKVLWLYANVHVYLHVIQKLAQVGEDIHSFLFRYPISKLTIAEAIQVEMLITTLDVQKPVLKASDIFSIGTRSLSSISGAIVTYVLVALQFHISWKKNQETSCNCKPVQ